MRLYLVQHGQAAAKDVDPARPLTDRGRADVEKVAAFIKPLNLYVSTVWHSGKTRAAQTAELLAAAVRTDNRCLERPGLAPNDDVLPVKDELARAQHDIMIVGHLPFLSKLASLLLADDESAAPVAFQQAGLVCLQRAPEKKWQLDWMITPQLLT